MLLRLLPPEDVIQQHPSSDRPNFKGSHCVPFPLKKRLALLPTFFVWYTSVLAQDSLESIPMKDSKGKAANAAFPFLSYPQKLARLVLLGVQEHPGQWGLSPLPEKLARLVLGEQRTTPPAQDRLGVLHR